MLGVSIVIVSLLWIITRHSTSAHVRQFLLLTASYVFYAMWAQRLLAVLIFSSLMNFALAGYLRRRPTARRVWLGVSANLALLSLFKYLPPLSAFASVRGAAPWLAQIVLPLGLSFWTFQAISHLLDIYHDEDATPSLLEFCLYMAFWPTVVAGPICRLPDMLPQFRKPLVASRDAIGRGVQGILTGLGMMALSQLLSSGIAPGQGVDGGFSVPAQRLGGFDVWCLASAYGFQLFFNFAGYSHIAIGTAELFDIRLPENFNRPYLSVTPSEFWTRWHMSLSYWIRDYLFFPLATMRASTLWRNLSLVLTMFLFGLWHRGSVLFGLWGIYHGMLLVAHRLIQPLLTRWNFDRYGRLLTPVSWLVTFLAVTLGWILFRAETSTQAFEMFHAIISPGRYHHPSLSPNFYYFTALTLAGYFTVVATAAALDRLTARFAVRDRDARAGFTARSLGGTAVMELVCDRWIWIGPVAAVLALYAACVIHFQGPVVGPMLYQVF
jgi:alginate O-acetyltransferase complex protein AlgI